MGGLNIAQYIGNVLRGCFYMYIQIQWQTYSKCNYGTLPNLDDLDHSYITSKKFFRLYS